MGHIGLTIALEDLFVGLLCKAKRVEEPHTRQCSREVSNGLGICGRRALVHDSKNQSHSKYTKNGVDDKLHHFVD